MQSPWLADLYATTGEFSEAESLVKQAIPIVELSLGKKSPVLASIFHTLGNIYYGIGRYFDAEQAYVNALKLLGPGKTSKWVIANFSLGQTCFALGRYDAAKGYYDHALGAIENLEPIQTDIRLGIQGGFAELLGEQGEFSKAEELFKTAIADAESRGLRNNQNIATAFDGLGKIYFKQGKLLEAEIKYMTAMNIFESTLGAWHPKVGVVANNLGVLYYVKGQYEDATNQWLRGLAIAAKHLPLSSRDLAFALNNLSKIDSSQGKLQLAKSSLEKACRTLRESLGATHDATKTCEGNLEVARDMGVDP